MKMCDSMRYELGFIGAGNMAEAIARAALSQNLLQPSQMLAADPSEARRGLFGTMGMTVTTDNRQVVRESRQVMLAVKPQMFATVAGDIAVELTGDHILISIMAGMPTHQISGLIQRALPERHSLKNRPLRIIRVMPNTPLLVGLGMSGVACGKGAQAGDETLTLQLFAAAGKTMLVSEEKIDAITAVSGSGPAYLFYLAEAMEKAARELGLGDDARLLVQQTLMGAATLLAHSPDTAGELRRKVSSPGGTTEAAIKHMEGNATISVIVNAVKAAEKRARELGQS